MKRFSIIIPVYNEERTIEAILDKVRAAALPPGFSKEVIIVDDRSADRTIEILGALSSKHEFKLVRHEKNAGKGAAIRTGLAASSGDFVVIQDADLEYDPADYQALLAPLVAGEADAVFGSRYMGKKVREVMSINFFANKVLTALSNVFTGFRLTDMETCYKVFPGPAARAIGSRMKARRFDMEPEITSLAADLGLSVVEVPIRYEPRTARQGKKIKWHDGFPAVWTIAKTGLPGFWKRRKWPIVAVISLILVISLFCIFQGPRPIGDSPTYALAIDIMNGAEPPAGFVPMRLLTTFGALEIIRWSAYLFGSIYPGWFILNSLLYLFACAVFYKLIVRIVGSEKAGYLGMMFLAANYGFLLFGLNYLMDIGGWAFYVFSIYLLWRYMKSGRARHILWAAAMVGVGGLFKEYAFLAALAIAVCLIAEARQRFVRSLRLALITAGIALVPTLILYAYIYSRFGYTYLDWFGFNSGYYVYSSRVLEYIKCLGSLMNVLAIVFLGGLWVFVKRWNEVGREVKVFLLAVLISVVPIFFWPAITQRIMTITVPFIALVSAFWFKRFEVRWYYFVPVLVLYVLATFFMDSYILTAVNLPF